MDAFKTTAPVVDPTKHVNYFYGKMLGVDDFTQEFAYHSNRDLWAARDIAGYGTLAGLHVTAGETESGDFGINVTAGTAVSPRGQLIRVPAEQHAEINKWLAVEQNRAAAVRAAGPPPASSLKLYVVLCYRDLPTDDVPVLGGPGHLGEEAVAPSRLQDGFLLQLRLEAPRQTEEAAVRDFVRWLAGHTEFTAEPGACTGLDDFLARLRDAAGGVSPRPGDPSSPPSDFMRDSPPDVMRVDAARRGEYLRAAFRYWVTELRPRWRPEYPEGLSDCPADSKGGGDKDNDDDDCLLLAELSVPLTADFRVDAARGVEVIEDRRPYLLHQRMIQEWLLEDGCCARASPTDGAPTSHAPRRTLALEDLADVAAHAPQEGAVLTYRGGRWVAAAAPAPPPGTAGEGGDNLTKVVRSRGGVKLTLGGADGQGMMILETPGGQKITLKDDPGAIEIVDSSGNSIRLEAAGVTVTSAAKVTISASAVEVSAGAVTVNAGTSKFSGVVQCDTLISNAVVSSSYTPGAGNIL